MHARCIERFHGKRRIVAEAIIVLNWGLMMRIVAASLMPTSMMVVKMILMMLFVIHLQLAHIESRQASTRCALVLTWKQESVLNPK